jgi:predicted PurR-regulated permease PerM
MIATDDHPPPGPAERRHPLESGARRGPRIVFAVALVALALWVVRDYVVALVWAVLIAVSVWPLYRRYVDARGARERRGPAAALFTVVTGLAVLVPLTILMVEIGREAHTITEWLKSAQESGVPVPEWLVRVPLLGRMAEEWWRSNLAAPQQAGELLKGFDLNTLASWSQAFGGRLLHGLVLLLFTFMALFLLFRDGDRFAARGLDFIDRALGDPGERLATKLAGAVRGTVLGTVVVAFGEGIIIGAAYVFLGVPHAVLFGALTIVVAMFPMGAWLAFGAAALVLAFSGGSVLAAVVLFGFGAVVMLIGDNFVQPYLIGNAVRLPFLWVLIGIAGGVQTLGIVGLFIGPVLMAALVTLWREWVGPPDKPSAA